MFMCVVRGGERREGEGGLAEKDQKDDFFYSNETSLSQNKTLDFVCYKLCTMYKYVSAEYVVVALATYLHYIFWSTETKVHSIDGEGNGRQTVYFTTFKYVLGRRRRRRKGGRGRGE